MGRGKGPLGVGRWEASRDCTLSIAAVPMVNGGCSLTDWTAPPPPPFWGGGGVILDLCYRTQGVSGVCTLDRAQVGGGGGVILSQFGHNAPSRTLLGRIVEGRAGEGGGGSGL